MEYFSLLDKVQINGITLTDISNLIKITSNVSDLTNEYVLKENESPLDVAYSLYGDDSYYWLVYLANPGYIFNEIMNTDEFNAFIDKNYNKTVFKLNQEMFKPNTDDYRIYAKDPDLNEYELLKADFKRNLFIFDSILPDNSSLFFEDNSEHLLNAEQLLYKDATHSYLDNGIWYDIIPYNYDLENVEKKSFFDYEFDKNEEKRYIKVIKPKYVQNVIDGIREYAKS